jgi:hypothetical protein
MQARLTGELRDRRRCSRLRLRKLPNTARADVWAAALTNKKPISALSPRQSL